MEERVFDAPLKQNGEMDAAYIEIPFDLEKTYGAKRAKVLARLNGVEYRGSVVRMGTTSHIIGIPKAIRRKMGVSFGDWIHAEICLDEQPRIVKPPKNLAQGLSREAAAAFDALPYTKQKEYVRWVEEAKRADTRARRIARVINALESKS